MAEGRGRMLEARLTDIGGVRKINSKLGMVPDVSASATIQHIAVRPDASNIHLDDRGMLWCQNQFIRVCSQARILISVKTQSGGTAFE